MEQNRQKMAEILRELQDIQSWALDNSIHTFDIGARVYPLDEEEGNTEEDLLAEYGDTEDREITVTIFLRGDDSDDDYLSAHIYANMQMATINNYFSMIRDFIGMSED